MCKTRVIAGILIVIALVGLPMGVQAQSDEGLVAEWHFDEGSGSVLKDSSGNGYDGVIHGATWVEGKYGGALSFDGVNDYVDIPDWDWATNMNYVVMAWVKTTDIDYQSQGWRVGAPILGDSANSVRGEIGLDNGKISYDYYNGIGHEVNGISTVADGSWHFLVWVNHDDDTIDLYVDSICETCSATNGPVDDETIFVVREIGRGYSDFFKGNIDEVRIYNRALSAEEIKSQYEQGSIALSLTKSASPNSIKQGKTTTITLAVKNTGSTELYDIEVADTFDSNCFIDGETHKIYAFLKPKDSREFQYVLQFDEAGTYNLDPATAMYANENGDYYTIESKPISIDVKSSIIPTSTYQSSKISSNNAQTASVHLHGEKTDVVMGEDILLKLAAVNLITKPTMHVQVIITPPSGMSVTSSKFVQSGAGLFTASYEIEPGVGRDIEVRMRSNQVGDFVVNGRIVYYFGDEIDEAEDYTLNLPIKVRVEPGVEQTESPQDTPGFAAVVAIIGLLVVYVRKRL
jgi:hypothetical protein